MDADIHRILGEALRGKKELKRATEEYETALELKPKDIDIQLGLAETYLASDRTADARKLVNDVLKKDESNEKAISLRNSINKNINK